MSHYDPKKPSERKPWTVMLYMAASKNEKTEQAAIRDLRELEKVGTDDSTLNVLVQIDRNWPGYAERYCVRKSFSEMCEGRRDEKNVNSGKPQVLRDFVAWGRSMFPADRYLLVLWGHSYGLGFGRDHGDPLTLTELAQSLDRDEVNKLLIERNALAIAANRKAVDILGANACAMCYAEAAYELKDAADFMVAPEISMPFQGWPYDRILNEIVDDSQIDSEGLGNKIVDQFKASFEEAVDAQNVALTMLNLNTAGEIRPHLAKLTAALRKSIGRGNGVREQIGDAFLDTVHGDVRPLIDLADLCRRLTAFPDTKASAEEFLEFLQRDELVVRHEASQELEGLNGLGIFAPSVSGAAELMRLEFSKRMYKELKLLKDLRDPDWATFVYKDLKELLDPLNKAVAAFVRSTGAGKAEERTGVAQLLVGIYQSFVKLQKSARDAQSNVMDVLNGNGAPKDLMTMSDQDLTTAAVWLSPPFLRLASEFAQTSSLPPCPRPSTNSADSQDPRESIVRSFERLEAALENVERTTKKVLTHASLGLGIEKDNLGIEKDNLGIEKDNLGIEKDNLGIEKDNLGIEKDNLGVFERLFASDGSQSSALSGIQSVTELFRLTTTSFQLVESAVGRTEVAVRAILTNKSSRSDKDYRQRLTEQVKRSFREVHETMTNARQTARLVIAHPTLGLGPTNQPGPGVINRQQLALAGGLSSQSLRLL
jgi:hypothetical protein